MLGMYDTFLHKKCTFLHVSYISACVIGIFAFALGYSQVEHFLMLISHIPFYTFIKIYTDY